MIEKPSSSEHTKHTKKELRIGLAGFGAMGRTHAYAIANLPYFYASAQFPLPFHAYVAGVCTMSKDSANFAASEFSLGKVYDNYDAMVKDPTIDIIDICTPNVLHFDMLRAALQNGKHIYCEKPLCSTLKEAETVAALAKNSPSICGIVFNCRHLSAVQHAKKIIDAGRIGKILSFHFEYLHDTCTYPEKSYGWKQNAEICGEGGVLFDLGSHIIDLAVWLCGTLDTVSAHSQIAYPAHPDKSGALWNTNASEAFYMIARTATGATGTLTASKIAKGTNDDLNFAIYGTEGALRFSLMEPGRLHYFNAKAPDAGFTTLELGGRFPAPGGIFPSPKAPSGWLMGHVASMYNFLSSVAEEKRCEPSFATGAYIHAVMQAALTSDQTGAVCKIPS